MLVIHGTLSLFHGPEDLNVLEQSLFTWSVITNKLVVQFRAMHMCAVTLICILINIDIVKISLSLLKLCKNKYLKAAQGYTVELVQLWYLPKHCFSRCPARVVSTNE